MCVLNIADELISASDFCVTDDSIGQLTSVVLMHKALLKQVVSEPDLGSHLIMSNGRLKRYLQKQSYK